jgi:hypothetical protein
MEDNQQEVEEQAEKTTLNFGQSEESTPQQEEGQVETNIDWTQDKRYGEHWGEDPNKLYESLKFHEKKQGEYTNQINEYKSQVEDLEKIKADYNTLEQLFDHPELGKELLGTIEKYQNPQDQQQGINNNYLQQEVNDIKKWKQDLENQALNHYKQDLKETQINLIDDFAKEHSIEYNKDDFQKAMEASNVDPQSWSHYFKSQAAEVALKKARNRAAEAALRNKNSTQSFSSLDNKQSSSPTNYNNYTDVLDKVLNIK